MYYFDQWGWLTSQPLPDRSTSVAPPSPQGDKRPNWTGKEWVLVTYFEPIAPVYQQPVPQSASPSQIRRALTRTPYGQTTLRVAVEAAVAQSDQDTQDWYEFATEFLINHEKVNSMCEALGVTQAQKEDLWRLAGTL